jgi:hypothetical protein
MAFDYEAPDVPATAVADVVADISSAGKPPPLSDKEREQRRIENELYRWQCQQRAEERAFEYQQRQQEAESLARHEAAIEQAEANRKARLERQEQISRQVRDREIANLRIQTAQQRGWMNNVETAARNAVAVRQRQALIADIESHFNPPPPPPEPEVIYVEAVEGSDQLGSSDFNPKLWMQKPRSWW